MLHEQGGNAAVSVFRQHVQAENALICALRVVEAAVFVHFVPDGGLIGHTAVDKAYDLSIVYGQEKGLRERGQTMGKGLASRRLGGGEADGLHSGDGVKVRGRGLDDLDVCFDVCILHGDLL